MGIDRLLCAVFGHAPFAARPQECSRCGRELPAVAPEAGTQATATLGDPFDDSWPLPPRGPMVPWWGLGPPPGWVEPRSRWLIDGRWQGKTEYRAMLARIFQRRKGAL